MNKTLLVIVLLSPGFSQAEVFKCEVSGKIVYQQKPCTSDAVQKEMSVGTSNHDSLKAKKSPTAVVEKPVVNDYSTVQHDYSVEDQTKIIRSVKEYVKNNMKDPDSTQFKDDFSIIRRRNNSTGEEFNVVHLFYNSKNSYGGYTGFKECIIRVQNDGQIIPSELDFL